MFLHSTSVYLSSLYYFSPIGQHNVFDILSPLIFLVYVEFFYNTTVGAWLETILYVQAINMVNNAVHIFLELQQVTFTKYFPTKPNV